MTEMIVCPKCKGKGETRGKIDWFMGVMSLGMTALVEASDWEECDICNGKGFIKNER